MHKRSAFFTFAFQHEQICASQTALAVSTKQQARRSVFSSGRDSSLDHTRPLWGAFQMQAGGRGEA